MNTNTNNLNTFKTLYLIYGILLIALSILPLLYAFLGNFLSGMNEFQQAGQDINFNPGIIFIAFGLGGFMLLVTLGILNILASKHIRHLRKYRFIFVVAVMNCITGIPGIVLGVFTIVELNKEHVRQLFEHQV